MSINAPDNLASKIENARLGEAVPAVLMTDQRILARVTDGIYRQPASAFRELISNAYDADASRVVIKTDAPRFNKITIEDDGHGMSPHVLAHILQHIGGSAKRSLVGGLLEITAPGNPHLSPGGRKLIGKIGIGLFSVAQITHSFQIITKTKGCSFRTIASVVLKQYNEEAIDDFDHQMYEAGKVNIWKEKASDVDSHGTTIVLNSIRPQSKAALMSREMWESLHANDGFNEDVRQTVERPLYHIGLTDFSTTTSDVRIEYKKGSFDSLPWEDNDSPEVAFNKIVDAVWSEPLVSNPHPELKKIFDYYLSMIWQLSLSSPLPYYDIHPFDAPLSSWGNAYLLSNEAKGSAVEIEADNKMTAREVLGLEAEREKYDFNVLFDDLKLARPIKIRNLPKSKAKLDKTLIFFGKHDPDFSKVPEEFRGGKLSFEAYMLWAPKITPREHQGVLLRIHGSSGTLFDSKFLQYQTSELVRLRQIVCEIFIKDGLDSALNIDRESFNLSHPHVVYITKWLHNSLRQLATAQKRTASGARDHDRRQVLEHRLQEIETIVKSIRKYLGAEEGVSVPSLRLAPMSFEDADLDTYVVPIDMVIQPSSTSRKATALEASRLQLLQSKTEAIGNVLAAFRLFELSSEKDRIEILRTVYKILEANDV